ncbi:MAG: acyl-CoA synthetase [Chloroflexota bacterium]|nr:acyl-CoA synthetase [Chloroflexota bacterium]
MSIPLIDRAETFADRTAVIADEGAFTYAQLLADSAAVASCLLDGAADLAEARVAFLTPGGYHYVATQWGVWRAGGVAVPLATSHPKPELAYMIEDSGATIVVAHPQYEDTLRELAGERGLRFLLTPDILQHESSPLPDVAPERRAMIIYTSGTTNRPKGVVSTHNNIQAQMTSLVEAWGWTGNDHILHVLPLHHIHGIVNVLGCALWSGAVCDMLPAFNADAVWDRIERGGLTLFMAVPTIYARLVQAWCAAPPERRASMTKACAGLRLMVSGSAALPVQTLEEWEEISGHRLLERYGMTEIGMALSNPLVGERRPGYVGTPLPGVGLRLVDENGNAPPEGSPGEIQVQGPCVFIEYWNKPEATASEFVDGWFKTGDVAVLEDGAYRILGRSSVDIIKTGGYKVSALEVEDVLREHPDIAECAVVAMEDIEWGERVCAALVLARHGALTLEQLRDWSRERLAPYKMPSRMIELAELPRNAMGKVVKPDLSKLFTETEKQVEVSGG